MKSIFLSAMISTSFVLAGCVTTNPPPVAVKAAPAPTPAPAPKPAPASKVAPAPPQKYIFQLFAFGISNTRSRHTDTDYVSCGLSVNGVKYTPIVKAMGDLNNGIYQVQLNFPAVAVDTNTTIIYNYTIVNAGHGDPAQVQNAISTGVGQALDEADSGDDSGDDTGSGSDEPWKSIIKAAVAVGNVLFFANCDGVVANDQFKFTGSQILALGIPVTRPYTKRTEYPGTDSPAGCGSNSKYDVTYAIIRVR